MEINAYSRTNNVNDSIKVQKTNESLNMQDFLNLLVAQISNQDVLNPMDNTEFIAQMAQFSTLQAMSDLTELSMQGQVTSLIGKNVTVADYNDYGKLEIHEGIVQKVTLYSGSAKLYIDDMEFDYSNIMEIKDISVKEDSMKEVMENILREVKEISGLKKSSDIQRDDNEELISFVE